MVLVLLAGCGGTSAAPSTAPPAAPSTAQRSRSARPGSSREQRVQRAQAGGSARTRSGGPAYSTWRLGAHPLPLRPDGYGVVRPTPRSLRVRRYRTADLLPPPADGRFHASIGPITPAIRRRMGRTWEPGCPVPLSGLRYLRMGFHGFDGLAHTGEMVVNARVATAVVSVFRRLFAARFPIEEMRLPTTADLDAHPTGDGNDTASMVCRDARGSTVLSAHAYGLAIDLDPFDNPYHRGDVVLPELASAYLDRSWVRPGMVEPGGVAVRAFAAIGWSWGGDWHSLKDYEHFTATGR
ncbi:MAG: M15 family metallopeptidase [Nocardioidaceae bacterium]|nr:M15 family metallopeptidase [Nocardioidaceae bacterium]